MKIVDGFRRCATGVVVALCISGAWATSGASAAGCPNDAVRSYAERALPDCRAYEQVSPERKNGNDAAVGGTSRGMIIAAADGSGVAFETQNTFPGAVGSALYNANLSRRQHERWNTQGIVPPQAPRPSLDYPSFQFFTPNLGMSVVRTPAAPSLALGATNGANNLYLRNSADGSYTTISTKAPAVQSPLSIAYGFAGASADLKHVLFASNDALTPDAPMPPDPNTAWYNLYEWVDGQVRLVTVLPNGTPSPQGGVAGGVNGEPSMTAMSEDGSRIVFAADDTQIYVREDGQRTAKVSASQRATPDPSAGTPAFWGASVDGSKVFFSSPEALTDDATVGVNSLYRYDVESGVLTDLAVDPDPTAPSGGGIASVLGISRDGAYVYFQSDRQYVPGHGVLGQANLYVWHDGVITYVATDSVPTSDTARLTPDGRYLIFTALASLTAYDNTDVATGQPDSQVYLYDAQLGSLTCVSCNPDGGRPMGASTLPSPPGRAPGNRQRGVSYDGRRVFFETKDDLVPADLNGKIDVYEYESGAVHLLSTGASADNSFFGDASTTGDDVFIATRERLVPTDIDDNVDIYDVRVDGGFSYPSSPDPCTGDGCQDPATSKPVLVAPTSSSVAANGNGPADAAPSRDFRVAGLSKSARRNAARTGYLTLSIRVFTGGILKARVSRTVHRHATTVGSGKTNVARAATVRLRLRLHRSARVALASGKKIKLLVRVSFSHARSAKTMVLELQR
jgi:Tol biopolymer transport system component